VVHKLPLDEEDRLIALIEVRDYLTKEKLFFGAFTTLPISENKDTQVYRIFYEKGKSIVLKRFSDRLAFLKERFCLQMFQNLSCVPMLMGSGSLTSNILALEDLPAFIEKGCQRSFLRAAGELGRLHAFGCEFGLRLRREYSIPSLQDVIDTGLMAEDEMWIAKRELQIMGGRGGGGAIGDLKLEHVRNEGGRIVFVDFETFSWGRPTLIDFFALVAVSGLSPFDVVFCADISSSYAKGRGFKSGPAWSPYLIEKALVNYFSNFSLGGVPGFNGTSFWTPTTSC
jgi:hypothetical protein